MAKVADEVRQIKRFPRLTTALNATAYARLLWADPSVRILFSKKSSATQFIFTVPVPPQFRESYALQYRMIFENFEWQKAVREAYDEGTYGGKDIETYISLGLHKVFIDAIGKWRQFVRTLAHENDLITADTLDDSLLGEFRQGPKRKTGPQPDAHVALWAANRVKVLLPRVSKLRRTFKDRNDRAKDKDLAVAIEKLASWDVVRRALTTILAEQGRIEPRQLLTPDLSNEKITHAIVQAKLEKKGYDFQKISFRAYLRLGRKLLEQMADGSTAASLRTVQPR
jgi:hypothetical protein